MYLLCIPQAHQGRQEGERVEGAGEENHHAVCRQPQTGKGDTQHRVCTFSKDLVNGF